MFDQRAYPRIKVSVPAILHERKENREINCTVKNVCESGVSFIIPLKEKYAEKVQRGDYIHFQFIDTYLYGKKEESDLLSNDCLIRYISYSEDSMTIGCYVVDQEFRDYAVRKEVLACMNRKAAFV